MTQHNEFEKWDQIYRRFQQTQGLPFSELLKPEQVVPALAAMGLEFRERIFEPIVTLRAFLSQVLSAVHSCRAVGERLVVEGTTLLKWVRRFVGAEPGNQFSKSLKTAQVLEQEIAEETERTFSVPDSTRNANLR
jgi:hypothetical protein